MKGQTETGWGGWVRTEKIRCSGEEGLPDNPVAVADVSAKITKLPGQNLKKIIKRPGTDGRKNEINNRNLRSSKKEKRRGGLGKIKQS